MRDVPETRSSGASPAAPAGWPSPGRSCRDGRVGDLQLGLLVGDAALDSHHLLTVELVSAHSEQIDRPAEHRQPEEQAEGHEQDRCRGFISRLRHDVGEADERNRTDRKSTRLNSSHVAISYAVFCLKKKNAI